MIPKVIHYVWLGNGRKSPIVEQCMSSWLKILPEYEIREWNDADFEKMEKCKYAQQAYDAGKWAFVSDYIRLKALYEYGGLYFDTDFEVYKKLDNFLDCRGFLCVESKHTISTAIIAAEPKTPWIKELLDEYNKISFINGDGLMDKTPNTKRVQWFLERKYNYLYRNNVQKFNNGLVVYPSEYFSPLNCFTGRIRKTSNTVGIHHYDNTWKSPKDKFKKKLLQFMTLIIGEDLRAKLAGIARKK